MNFPVFADSCGTRGTQSISSHREQALKLPGWGKRTGGPAGPQCTQVYTHEGQGEPHVNLCSHIPKDRSKLSVPTGCRVEPSAPWKLLLVNGWAPNAPGLMPPGLLSDVPGGDALTWATGGGKEIEVAGRNKGREKEGGNQLQENDFYDVVYSVSP